ncbi:hypothetical protein SUGI_0550180 [Cryptomeria japonica]|nr:hypothetical protein SUGI_0550180 [Cryptomeria japonica]
MAVDGMLPVGYPEKIHEAMRYSLLSAPPKMRCPLLCTAACHVINGTRKQSLPAATAVAMLHASMLAHDELPCMDSWGCFVWLGLVVGQNMGSVAARSSVAIDPTLLEYIHFHKAVLMAEISMVIGGNVGGGSHGDVERLRGYGRSIVDELIVKAKDFLSFFAHTLAAPLLSFADYAATRSY